MPVDASSEVGQLVSEHYPLGAPDRCWRIQCGLNETYGVEVSGSCYAFRVHGPNKWWIGGEGDLRFELELLDHLRREGAPISFPIPRRDGDCLGRVEMARGSRYCTLFSWAPGRPRGRDLDGEAASTVGRTLATIHVAADGYVSRFPRYSLDEHTLLDRPLRLMEPTLRRDSVADARFIREQAEEIRVRLRSFGQGDGRWGVIHGDVQVLNYHLTAGGDITFFDFDLCGYGWRLYDIASYVTRIPPNAREPVLHGYESVLPLSEQDREFLPTFGRLAWIREGLQSKDLVKKLGDPNMSSGF